MIDIYKTYGYSKEKGVSLVRQGKSGAEEIAAIMKQFRENPIKSLAGSPVVMVKDFATLEAKDMTNGNVEKLDMPVTSNVLQYFTADGTKISIRPSGTEPKLKVYYGVVGTCHNDADTKLAKLSEQVLSIVKSIESLNYYN